jgi:hypothetical protein
VYILLSDGTQQTLTEVELLADRLDVPGNDQVAFALPTAQPTTVPGMTTFNLPTGVPVMQPTSAIVVVTAAPATPQLVFATSAPQVASPDVSLFYDGRSLFLVNTSSGAVNLNGVSIVGSNRTLTLERWAQFAGNLNLGAYPAGHCLQAEQSGTNAPSPGPCRSVRSVIEYQPGQVFWSQGPFTVMRGNQTLATCQPTAGRCEVDLG